MAVSANGWPVLDRTQVSAIHIGGGPAGEVALTVTKDPDIRLILAAVATFVDRSVEDIHARKGVRGWETPDDWGYADRKIRGARTAISNHASGTAIDLNALHHPMGSKGTWSKAQVAATDRFLAGFRGVVRWGEHYRQRTDGMHFEINVPPSQRALIRQAAAYARAYLNPASALGPIRIARTLRYRRLAPMRGADVAAVQRALNLRPTGVYDLGTANAVDAVQGKLGVGRDGVWGPTTTRAADAHHLDGRRWSWEGK